MDANLTKSERETLKAIYRLTARQDQVGAAHTGDLAETLGVTPGTMTATVKRLADRGLVDHVPYRGVELTGVGRRRWRWRSSGAIASSSASSPTCSATGGTKPIAWPRASSTTCPRRSRTGSSSPCDRPSTCPHGFPDPRPRE